MPCQLNTICIIANRRKFLEQQIRGSKRLQLYIHGGWMPEAIVPRFYVPSLGAEAGFPLQYHTDHISLQTRSFKPKPTTPFDDKTPTDRDSMSYSTLLSLW